MSFPRYPKYKDSGVEWLGEVPAIWDLRRIRTLFEIKKQIAGELGFEVFSVTQNGLRVKDIESNEGQLSMDYSKYQLVEIGDFVINPMDLITGGADVATSRGVTSPDYRVFLLRDTTTCHDNYFKYLFQMAYRQRIFFHLGQGSSQLGRWRLPRDEFNNFLFPFPPIVEQNRIASFLDHETAKIDALVAEQRRLIELLKEKRQAVISHAVTKGLDSNAKLKPSGIDWLGDVPEHWEVMKVKHLADTIEQGWSPQCEGFPVDSPEQWGVLKVGCVNTGSFNADENKVLPVDLEPIPQLAISRGDLLISRANTRELVGRAAVAQADYPRLILCDKLYRLRLRSQLGVPAFLSLYLGSDRGRGPIELAASGASQSMVNIGQSVILEMDIAIPPLNEQNEIVETVGNRTAELEALTAYAESAISLLQERRNALISAAVTGKIDVRGLSKTEAA